MRKAVIYRQIFWTVLSAVLTVMLYQWWAISAAMAQTLPAILVALGRLSGFLATLAILLQVVLMARLPLIEQGFGTDQFTRWHKRIGKSIFYLIVAHVVFLVWGYQVNGRPGWWTQFVNFVLDYPDMLKAFLGSLAFIGVIGLSINLARRRLKYEFWYVTHLLVYGAILLVFGHQFSNGREFIGQTWFVLYWYAVYALAAGSVVAYRIIPIGWRWWRHRLVVEKIVREAEDTYSVYVIGRDVGRLHARAGQWYGWRFIAPGLWWQNHPFSLSAAPNGHRLRLTFRVVGDFTAALPRVKPGTPVLLDGPRGNFTLDRAAGRPMLWLAGGIGVTPFRAMAEALPVGANVVLVYAGRRKRLAFSAEFEALAAAHPGLRVVQLVRETDGRISIDRLASLVPDWKQRDLYVCGPASMTAELTAAALEAGVAPDRIHSEAFAL